MPWRANPSALGSEGSDEAVGLMSRSGGEDECVGVAEHAVAEVHAPEPVDDDRPMVLVAERAEELAGAGVEGVDQPVTEVADEQRAAEAAEALRCQIDAPRRVGSR